MSQFELNPMFLRMRKSIGDMVIYERDGQLYTRVKGRKTGRNSPAQIAVNEAFARLSSDWSTAGPLMNSGWYILGDRKKLNGYNLFMKMNFKNEREGRPIDLFQPMNGMPSPVISASPGSAGEIELSCVMPEGSTGRFMNFFFKKRVNGVSDGLIKRYSPDAPGAQVYRLSGLEPGAEYFVYAVLTDAAYNVAKDVSASAGLTATAGV